MNSYKKWEEIIFPLPWGHIAGKKWGKPNGKRILAVHGWHENSNSFDPLSSYFPDDWFVVAIDLSGHGKSSHLPPGSLYDCFGFVMQIKRVVNYLGWKEFSCIGHSFGGGIAIVYSCVFPNQIISLVSLDLIKLTSKPATDKELLINLRKMFAQWEKVENFKGQNLPPRSFSISKAIELIINVSFGSLDEKSANVLLSRGSTSTGTGNEDEVVFNRDAALSVLPFEYFVSEFYETILTGFTSNLMIIKATKGANVEEEEIGEKFIEIYRRVCPNFEFLIMEGTHHFHMIQPEEISKPTIEFINKYHNQKSTESKL